jgi:hypothetical protein
MQDSLPLILFPYFVIPPAHVKIYSRKMEVEKLGKSWLKILIKEEKEEQKWVNLG